MNDDVYWLTKHDHSLRPQEKPQSISCQAASHIHTLGSFTKLGLFSSIVSTTLQPFLYIAAANGAENANTSHSLFKDTQQSRLFAFVWR